MTEPRGIIVLEGADASGKTTLATEIVNTFDAEYLHAGLALSMFDYHAQLLDKAISLSQRGLVVLDRHWISEQLYGPVMRNKSAYNLAARCFDRVLQKHGAIYVICAPYDQQAQYAVWQRDRDAGKDEYPDDLRIKTLIADYADLMAGNLGHPGDLYIDQLIRWGDFARRTDVLRWDMIENGRHAKKFTKSLIGYLQDRRAQQFPSALLRNHTNLTGHAGTATHLIVGEALSPRAPGPWPFFWSDQMSAATYLNEALHSIKHDETITIFMNAKVAGAIVDQRFDRLLEWADLKVIALGRVADKVLNTQRIDHTYLPHPQWARRFDHGGLTNYAKKLKEALS